MKFVDDDDDDEYNTN